MQCFLWYLNNLRKKNNNIIFKKILIIKLIMYNLIIININVKNL